MHNLDYSEELVSLLLKEGARVDIIDNVSIIHVHAVIHVYLLPILTEQMCV